MGTENISDDPASEQGAQPSHSPDEASRKETSNSTNEPPGINVAVNPELDQPEAFDKTIRDSGGGETSKPSVSLLQEIPYNPDSTNDKTRPATEINPDPASEQGTQPSHSPDEASRKETGNSTNEPPGINVAVNPELDQPEAFDKTIRDSGGGETRESSVSLLQEIPYNPDSTNDKTRPATEINPDPASEQGTQPSHSPDEASRKETGNSTNEPPGINVAVNPELDQPEEFGKTVKASGGGETRESSVSLLQEIPYNPDESRDFTRHTITLWLIGLLCSIVGLTFVALFARGASTGFTDKAFFQELKQVLDVLVGPVITLLASAIGFYFGYKQGGVSAPPPSGGTKT